jgi:hypothetical protein
MIEKREITLTINGRSHGVRIDPRWSTANRCVRA